MPKQYWPEKHRARANSILTEFQAVNRLKPSPPGQITLIAFFPQQLEVRLRALASLMKGYWPNGNAITWDTLRRVITELHKEGPTTLEAIESKLDEAWVAHRRHEQSSQATHRVAFAVDVHLQDDDTLPLTLPLADHTITLERSTTPNDILARRLSDCDLRTQAVFANNTSGIFAWMDVQASSAASAMQNGMEVYELWRSFYNYLRSLNTVSGSFVARSRSPLPAPRWVVCPSSTPCVVHTTGGDIIQREASSPAIGLEGDTCLHACEMIKSLSSSHGSKSTSSLLLDAVRLYGLAMDQDAWHQALLVFWRLAEHLTLITPSDKHDKICQRLPFLGLSSSTLEPAAWFDALMGTKRLRHRIVHESAHHVATDGDVEFMRRCCCQSIQWLLHHREMLPTTDHLRHYFDIARLPGHEQCVIGEVLELTRPKADDS